VGARRLKVTLSILLASTDDLTAARKLVLPGWPGGCPWLWQDAVHAVVIYIRAVAARRAMPVNEIARQIAARHGLELAA